MRIILSVGENFHNLLNIIIYLGALQFRMLEGFAEVENECLRERTQIVISYNQVK